jgi:hypothetical protein
MSSHFPQFQTLADFYLWTAPLQMLWISTSPGTLHLSLYDIPSSFPYAKSSWSILVSYHIYLSEYFPPLMWQSFKRCGLVKESKNDSNHHSMKNFKSRSRSSSKTKEHSAGWRTEKMSCPSWLSPCGLPQLQLKMNLGFLYIFIYLPARNEENGEVNGNITEHT